MSALQLELVLDPAEPTHQRLAEGLQRHLAPHESLRLTAWSHWRPALCRSPGSTADLPIVLLLAPARWWRTIPGPVALPKDVLVVAELPEGAAREIGPATGLQAPAEGAPASGFGVFAFTQASSKDPSFAEPSRTDPSRASLRCLVQLRLPSLSRWRHHQSRCLLALADALIWWLRLCEQRRQLLRIAPLEEALPLLPAVRASVPQRLRSRRRWLLGSARRRWSGWRGGAASPWQIAIGRLEPGTETVQIVHRLPSQGNDWFADPFLLADGPDLWLFCERWQASLGKGAIDLFAVRPEGLVPCGTVLDEPFHLSFPRVIRHAGSWWATVESAAAGEVRLYHVEDFPLRWRLERVLLRDQPWIDPILIPSEGGGWWLLVNSHNTPALPGATAPELHLFHSPDLLYGNFEPHPCSPLLFDSTCGRNGGLLELDGALIRVGQCTGIDNAYGEAVQLRRIGQITAGDYRETAVQPLWLATLKRQLGASHLHTLNNAAEWLALDYIPRH